MCIWLVEEMMQTDVPVAAEQHVQFILNWRNKIQQEVFILLQAIQIVSNRKLFISISVCIIRRLTSLWTCGLLLLAANFYIPTFVFLPLTKCNTHSVFCSSAAGFDWRAGTSSSLAERNAARCWRKKMKKNCKKVKGGPYVSVCLFPPRKAVERELCNQRSNKPVDMLRCLSREWVVALATSPQALQVNGRKLKFAGC